MLPIRQLANYCLIAKTCYGFILTEREVTVLRFTAEPKPAIQSNRQVLPRAVAPQPGQLQMSSPASSYLDGGLTRMSLDSYQSSNNNVETITSAEIGIFPWNDKRRGLTGLFALFWLHVIATGPIEPPINRQLSEDYWDLWTVLDRMPGNKDKSGKSTKSTKSARKSGKTKEKRYKSLLSDHEFDELMRHMKVIQPKDLHGESEEEEEEEGELGEEGEMDEGDY